MDHVRTHFAIPVLDLKASQEFYESLGLQFVTSWEKPEQELKAVVLENDSGTRIELVHHPTNDAIKLPSVIEVLHIGLSVSAIDPLFDGKDVIKPITKGVSIKEFAFIQLDYQYRIDIGSPF